MKPLQKALIQKIIDKFEGNVSFKNSKREYFFVNEQWLRLSNLKREEVIGKTDNEILSLDNAIRAEKTDMKAFEKQIPIEYTNSVILNGERIDFIAIKFVINFGSGEHFFLCTIADFLYNKEKVLAFRKIIDAFFERKGRR
ncbi:MAG: hypothetical protein V4547_15245 [Bacteroidota bacterium]